MTESEAVRSIFAEVYRQAHGARAAEVIVWAAGARGIGGRVDELLPHAVPILDCSPAQPYLGEAAQLSYGEGAAFVSPGGKARDPLLLADTVPQVIPHLPACLDIRPALAPLLPYFAQNQGRRRYGTSRQRGDFIGAGAIESAGNQLAAGRIQGPGMRWNVTEGNALLKGRCLFLEPSWPKYWKTQGPLAAWSPLAGYAPFAAVKHYFSAFLRSLSFDSIKCRWYWPDPQLI
jgi:hypothetical protein